MSELTINQIIKITIGVFVFVAVVTGIYLFFREQVISFFQGIGNSTISEIFLNLLK